MKFRFQLNGVIEYGGNMTVAEVVAHISKELVGCEVTGVTVFEISEKRQGGKGTARKKEV